ncbi:ECs_2282 family putative zinc-binding protein [Celeribacter halophilus]|uniref:ECs_2282 family putative zinc-binding protein n=1 Tax=Celeribacter halophilus TaxID=576117 RepID=UPI003F72A8E6
MRKNLEKNITLNCPTCAGTEFLFESNLPPEDRQYQCASCKQSFTHFEILEMNEEKISAATNEIKSEIIADLKKSLRQRFK